MPHGILNVFLLICSSKAQASEAPATEGQHYCVDENTERRNHYLDLAGIENYTSRFEGKSVSISLWSYTKTNIYDFASSHFIKSVNLNIKSPNLKECLCILLVESIFADNNLSFKNLFCLCLVPQEPLLSFHLRKLIVEVHKTRAAPAPRSPKLRLSISGAHRSSVTATILQKLEGKVHSSSSLLKEPTKGVEETTGAVGEESPPNATAITQHCRPGRMAPTFQATEVRMCTTCRIILNPPATTSTLCSTATVNA